jgi:hypothetical protein
VTEELLFRPVVHEVLGDAEPGVALHVVEEVLLTIPRDQHLQREVGPPPLPRHVPTGPRVGLPGILHVEDGEDVGREHSLSRVEHGQIAGEVDASADAAEVLPQRGPGLLPGALVGDALRRDGLLLQGRAHTVEEGVAGGGRQGQPLVRGGDDERGRGLRCGGGERHGRSVAPP